MTASDATAWPPRLVISKAIKYTGCSRSTLNRAVRRGELVPLGRVGGRGARVFLRDDLDRWLAGDLPRTELDVDVRKLKPRSRATRATANASDTESALAKIRAVAKGGAL